MEAAGDLGIRLTLEAEPIGLGPDERVDPGPAAGGQSCIALIDGPEEVGPPTVAPLADYGQKGARATWPRLPWSGWRR